MIQTPLGELMTLPARVRVLFLLVDSEVVYLVSWHLAASHSSAPAPSECVMVRDGLAYLPDCFTAGDMSDIVIYLCICRLSSFEATVWCLYLLLCPAVSDCTFFYVVLWYFERLCTRYVYLYFYFTFYLKKTFLLCFSFFTFLIMYCVYNFMINKNKQITRQHSSRCNGTSARTERYA